MENIEKKFNEAKKLHQAGKVNEAQKIYLELLKNSPSDHKINFLTGTSYLQLKNYEKAITYLDNSINISPEFPHSYNSKGIVFSEMKLFEEAIRNYDKAILLKPDFLEAHLNRGISLKNIQEYDDALKSFEKCIEIDSLNPKIYNNLGNLFLENLKYADAKHAYDNAIMFNEKYAEAYEGRGDALQEIAKIEKDPSKLSLSITNYEKAFSLKPDLDYVYGKIVSTKMYVSDWSKTEEYLSKIKEEVNNNKKTIIPFPLLSLIDEPKLHKKCSEIFATDYPLKNLINTEKIKSEKIKIGYFCADFNEHPVSMLIAKMLSLHDKSKFKVFCYSFGFEKKDELHKWIESKVDVYRDIRKLNNEDVAKLAKNDGINIAIDLQGYTSKHRVGIFSYRAAPIQINFLGYPGTMGSNYFDYIIADENLIPETSREFYSEKPIYMPYQYQVQNDELKVSEIIPSKKELGLPEKSFIFCGINNTYKISPAIFDVWMKILHKVENSVLWLLDNNEVSKNNLLREARARNINGDRLIFSKRTAHDRYLAQFNHADLYLDTFNYNAGATASSALWMGVPVLTMAGISYAARMASSLLKSIDLPELITTSIYDYEKLALELSTRPEKLNAIKEKLKKNRSERPLFNTEMYTRHFEEGMSQVFNNFISGNKTKNIFIKK